MRRIVATVCIVFIASGSALGNGFSIYEASVRANGMLGALSAYADHVSTVYDNPAGLSELEGVESSGGASIIAPRASVRNSSSLRPPGRNTNTEDEASAVP